MTDPEFDAAALAILRPSWDDRELYGTPELQLKALRKLAGHRAVTEPPELTISMNEWAETHGFSRQFVDQALARSEDRPEPAVRIGDLFGYRAEDLDEWWMSYSTRRWQETRRVRGEHGAIQVNCRLGKLHVEQLDALRLPGEARASAATRILRAAVLAQLTGDPR
jgi:predicted DNA-binding transcriptional regulator AlpA